MVGFMSLNERISYYVTYIFSGLTVAFSKLNFNEWMMFGGFVVALLGYVTSLFFQWRKDRRESKIAAFAIAESKLNIQKGQEQK